MTFLEDFRNFIDRAKKFFSDKVISQIPFNTADYRFDETIKEWVPTEANIEDLHGIRIALQSLSNVADIDNKGISDQGSLVDSATISHVFEHQDLLFNTIRVIADCSSNIDLDIVVSYKNVLETDWIDVYSESLVPSDTKLNYRINIGEYTSIKVKLTNNSGATLNYNLILFFSKTKFRDIKIVTPTDDLQVALDVGGAIYLTTGIHSISSCLNIDQGKSVFLYGAGDDSLIQSVGDINVFNITSAISVVFKDFKIDASSLTTKNKQIIIVNETNDNIVKTQNVSIEGDGTNGIGIKVLSRYFSGWGCLFDSIDIGFSSEEDRSHFIKNTFLSMGSYAFYFGSSVGDNILSLNIIDTCGISAIYFNPEGNWNRIVSNIIIGCSKSGIHISNGSMYNEITNNSISECGSSSDDTFGAIHLSNGSDYNIIANNHMDNLTNNGAGTYHGIYIDNANCDYNIIGINTFVSIAGNNIENSGTNTKIIADNTAYNSTTWDANLGTATKNAIRDWIEAHLVADIHHAESHDHEEADITDLGSYLENVVEDATPELVSSGVIPIKPSGDNDDYLEFYTDSNLSRIKVIGGQTLGIESDDTNYVNLNIRKDGSNYFRLTFYKYSGGQLFSTAYIDIMPNSDTDDYIRFSTSAGIPKIERIGGTEIIIESDGSDTVLIIENTTDDSEIHLKGADDCKLQFYNGAVIKGALNWNLGNTSLILHTVTAVHKIKMYTGGVERFSINDSSAIFTVPIALGTNKITGVGDPDDAQDVSTKKHATHGIASNDLVFSNDTARSTNSESYVKIKEIAVYRSLNLRLYWEYYATQDGGTAYTRVYINGVAVGSEKSTGLLTPQSTTEDVEVNAVDLLQIYAKNVGVGSVTAQNMRIKFIEYVSNDP